MGIDLLAFSFDAEKEFRVRLDIGEFISHVRDSGRDDATVQERFDWLSTQIAAQRNVVPPDAWDRFVRELRKVAWDLKKGEAIQPEQLLLADLGLTG